MNKLISCIVILCMTVFYTNSVFAQNANELLRDIEPDAVMTSEQGNLEVVNTLYNVGDGSDIFYVVKEPDKHLQGLVQLKDNKIKTCLPLQYNYIDEISNVNYSDNINEYIYLYKEPNQHFAYNILDGKKTKLNLDVKAIDYSSNGDLTIKKYLGKFSCGDVFDLEGILCGNQISPAHIPMDIRYEQSETGLITSDFNRPMLHGLDILSLPASQPYRYITHSTKKYAPRAISFLIDFPKGNDIYDKTVKLWISDAIHKALWSSDLFVPITDNSPEKMVDFYAKNFFFTDSVKASDEYAIFPIGSPSFEFYRLWESDTYVTYRYCLYVNESENKYGPVTQFITFDKKTGIILDFNHVFVENRNREITEIIENQLKEDLWIWYYDLADLTNENAEDIKEQAKDDAIRCLKDIQEKQTKNPKDGWTFSDINISLTPEGVVLDIDDAIKGNAIIHIYPVIPYEKLMPYLAIIPMEKESHDVFLESIRCAGQNTKTEYKEDFKKNYLLSENLLNSVASEQGEESGEYLLILSQLAEEYSMTENTKRAIALRQRYLDIIEKQVGCHNYAWEANGKRQLRDLLLEKEYDKACIIGEKLSTMWPDKQDIYMSEEEKDNKCEQMEMMTDALFMSGNSQKAVALCYRAIHYTTNEELCLKGITQMSRYQYALNGVDSCISYIRKTIDEVPKLIYRKFHEYTAIKRKELWDKFQPWYCKFIPQIAYKTGNHQLITASYNAMLFGKGLLLNTESSIRQTYIHSGDTTLLKKYEYLQELKKKLNWIRTSKMNFDEKIDYTNDILEKKNETENGLITKYGGLSECMNINEGHLLTVLHDHELAIEFCLIEGDYYAMLLKHGYTEPKMIKLCSEEQLLTNHNVYTDIWSPLTEFLYDVSDIYFSPDGLLYNIGIEYAEIPSDEIPINEKYRIFRLSSTRELVITRNDKDAHPQTNNSAILYGGIDYDNKDRVVTKGETNLTYRSALDLKSLKRGSIHSLSYLPGTEKEVEMISKTLQETASPILVTTLSKTHATEASFKQLSGQKKNVIHLATHGFYFTKENANLMAGNPVINISNVNDSYVEDRELLRSGLLMAGAMTEKNEKIDDDGILTALEVASMDLSNADLIVLSACETALGDVSSEGVFGLQRGFKKAGARSLLMSLWKVDDTATQILMTEFYKGLINGQSKREALLNAQKHLRQYQDGKYDEPEYWASFILLDAFN